MLTLKLSSAFVPIMAHKKKTRRHAVCLRICTSHAKHFCVESVVALVSLPQWQKTVLAPLSRFAKLRRGPLKGTDRSSGRRHDRHYIEN